MPSFAFKDFCAGYSCCAINNITNKGLMRVLQLLRLFLHSCYYNYLLKGKIKQGIKKFALKAVLGWWH